VDKRGAGSAPLLQRTSWMASLAVFPRDVVDAGDGWEAAQSGVRPMVVVHVEPPREQVQARLVV
jgi:hypothetical protein